MGRTEVAKARSPLEPPSCARASAAPASCNARSTRGASSVAPMAPELAAWIQQVAGLGDVGGCEAFLE